MKKETISYIAAYALCMLFVYAAANKLYIYDLFVSDLKRSPLLGAYALPLSILVPTTEIALALMLMLPRWRSFGLAGSAMLMAAFTLYVSWVWFYAPERPCSCGGIFRNMRWDTHLIVNIFFLVVALVGYWLHRSAYRQMIAS